MKVTIIYSLLSLARSGLLLVMRFPPHLYLMLMTRFKLI
jgi:hypothetical protein